MRVSANSVGSSESALPSEPRSLASPSPAGVSFSGGSQAAICVGSCPAAAPLAFPARHSSFPPYEEHPFYAAGTVAVKAVLFVFSSDGQSLVKLSWDNILRLSGLGATLLFLSSSVFTMDFFAATNRRYLAVARMKGVSVALAKNASSALSLLLRSKVEGGISLSL
jgi:hypothetical protein